MTITLRDPLQVILCYNPNDKDAELYLEAVSRAFRGGDDMSEGYLAGGEDLGVQVLEFSEPGDIEGSVLVNDASHTLMVVLVGRKLLDVGDFTNWLDAGMEAVTDDDSRHGLVVFDLDSSSEAFRELCPHSSSSNHILTARLSEQAVAPAMAGLIALYNAYGCLAHGTPNLSDRLKLFFSHAKLDGQPSAYALKALVHQTPALQAFYDADDISPGDNFEKILQQGVQDSVLVVLRTEAFESRPWCRKEVRWAERYSAPMVVVDLRSRLIHGPSVLALDQAPNIRLPDGNLFRILYVAVREGVRVALLARQVEHVRKQGTRLDEVRVLPRRPTMYAIHNACQLLSQTTGTGRRLIVYPDPPLPEGDYQAAMALVSDFGHNIELMTPQSLVG